jgi:hypothetical protein
MFINNNDIVEVKIYYKKDGFKYLALTDSEVSKRIKDKKLTKDQVSQEFKTLSVNMLVLSWGSYNRFQDTATLTNEKGERYFDYKTYKEQRLQSLVKSWDAKDAEGNDVKVSPKLIMQLAPTIGDAIVRGFDESSYYDEEAEKK